MKENGVVNVEAFNGVIRGVRFPAEEAVPAGTEGAKVGFTTGDGEVGNVGENRDRGD